MYFGSSFPRSKNLDSKDTWKPFDCIHLRFSIAKNTAGLVITCHYCGALAAGLCQSASIDFQQGQRLEVGSQPGGVLSTRAGHNCKIATSADLGHEVKTSDDDSVAAAKRCCTSLLTATVAHSVEAGDDGGCYGLSAERQPLPLQCPPSTAASLALCMMSKY